MDTVNAIAIDNSTKNGKKAEMDPDRKDRQFRVNQRPWAMKRSF